MSTKRLHVHSLPLLSFAIIVTVTTAVGAMAYGSGASFDSWSALTRPAVRLESGRSGSANIMPNTATIDEASGIQVELPASANAAGRAAEVGESVGLQIVLQGTMH